MGAFFWGDFGYWLQRGGESLKTSDFFLEEGFPGLTNIVSCFLTLTTLFSFSVVFLGINFPFWYG